MKPIRPPRLPDDDPPAGEPGDVLLGRLQDLVLAVGMACLLGLLFSPPPWP